MRTKFNHNERKSLTIKERGGEMKQSVVLGIVLCLTSFNVHTAQAGINDGLVAFYSFTNATLAGPVSDESGNGNDETDRVGVTPTVDRCGAPNGAYQFDGIDDPRHCRV